MLLSQNITRRLAATLVAATLLFGPVRGVICAADEPAPTAVPQAVSPDAQGIYRFETCHARLQGNLLTLGNAEVERQWLVHDNGALTSVSFKDLRSGTEWIKPPAAPANTPAPRAVLSVTAGSAGVTEEPSLLATLTVQGDGWSAATRCQIFPAARGIVMDRELQVKKSAPPPADVAALSLIDAFAPAPSWKITRVKYLDSTDSKPGPLVFEFPGGIDPQAAGKDGDAKSFPEKSHLALKGNVFYLENEPSGDGLLLLKHAPLPGARPAPAGKKRGENYDVETDEHQLKFFTNEITDIGGRSYRTVMLAYQGGRPGRIAALQVYYRQLRKYDPTRDGLFLTNTWGGHPPLNVPSMKAEIDAGARLGVDVMQIDDGWQTGKGDGRDALKNPDFWIPNPKNFPDGLRPLAAYARDKGMQIGIWFSPSYPDDFQAWEKDRAILLGLHRDAGVNFFKVDKLNISSRAGEANFGKLIDSVIQQSHGRAVVDLDVTLGARPGYFGITNHGPLFVENRYSRAANFANPQKEAPNAYWPHRTLRNFWLLSQYVDPLRLRMEFLNHEKDAKNYGDSPLAPASYPPDTLFASVMFGSPLGWFSTQSLPASYFEKVTPLVKTWKLHRAAIANGSIIPVGAMPDGKAWTGFVSVAQDRQSAYALVFRELNENPAWSVALPLLDKTVTAAKVLAGQGEARVEDQHLHVNLPAERSYLLVRLEKP